MVSLADLKAFDVANAELTLWTFKGTMPEVNGHWIETTDDLDNEMKAILSAQLQDVVEVIEYGLLAENNEGSALVIPADETLVDVIDEAIAQALPRRKIRNITTLRNARFYVMRLVSRERVVLAVRKTDTSWRTKSSRNIVPVIYRNNELDLCQDDGFKIHRSFDFVLMGDSIFILNKRNFESVLNYKIALEDDFGGLQEEGEFQGIFQSPESLGTFIEFVGVNKIHLRRVSAIRQKEFYKNEEFMQNLRDHHAEFGLNIQFDDMGRIILTPDNCRDIMTALLDHRLRSGFSGNNYDVPNAIRV